MISNMGSIKRAELQRFGDNVLRLLNLDDWEMLWTDRWPNICVKDRKKIFIHKDYIGRYPWEAKEIVLHEIAHIFSWPQDQTHGQVFYKEYVSLIQRFMVDQPL